MAYISGDGHIKVRPKGFHYEIGVYLDSFSLAMRVVNLFKKEFNIRPNVKGIKSLIRRGFGYYTIRTNSKPVCLHLLSIGKYNGLNWKIPPNLSKNLLKEWIKCYFDCGAYVNLPNRQIQVKSVNCFGLRDLKSRLLILGVDSKIYGPFDNGPNHSPYFMLCIFKKDNLSLYFKRIGFYHPKKKRALQKLLKRYVS